MTDRQRDAEQAVTDSAGLESSDSNRDSDGETLRDVSHTPPAGDGANRVWDGTRVYDGDDDE